MQFKNVMLNAGICPICKHSNSITFAPAEIDKKGCNIPFSCSACHLTGFADILSGTQTKS